MGEHALRHVRPGDVQHEERLVGRREQREGLLLRQHPHELLHVSGRAAAGQLGGGGGVARASLTLANDKVRDEWRWGGDEWIEHPVKMEV